ETTWTCALPDKWKQGPTLVFHASRPHRPPSWPPLFLQRRRVPDFDVDVAGGYDLVAVRAKGDPANHVVATAQRHDLLTGLRVPQLDRLIRPSAGDQAIAIGTERDPPDGLCVAAQDAGFLARCRVVEAHRVIGKRRGDDLPVGANR